MTRSGGSRPIHIIGTKIYMHIGDTRVDEEGKITKEGEVVIALILTHTTNRLIHTKHHDYKTNHNPYIYKTDPFYCTYTKHQGY